MVSSLTACLEVGSSRDSKELEEKNALTNIAADEALEKELLSLDPEERKYRKALADGEKRARVKANTAAVASAPASEWQVKWRRLVTSMALETFERIDESVDIGGDTHASMWSALSLLVGRAVQLTVGDSEAAPCIPRRAILLLRSAIKIGNESARMQGIISRH